MTRELVEAGVPAAISAVNMVPWRGRTMANSNQRAVMAGADPATHAAILSEALPYMLRSTGKPS